MSTPRTLVHPSGPWLVLGAVAVAGVASIAAPTHEPARLERLVPVPELIELELAGPAPSPDTVDFQWHRELCDHDFAIQVVTIGPHGPDDDACLEAPDVDLRGLLEIPLATVSDGCVGHVEAMQHLDTNDVHPDDADRDRIAERGEIPAIGLVKFCTGGPPRTTMLRTTGYPDYDEKLLAVVRGWRFDSPQQACGVIGFSYRVH